MAAATTGGTTMVVGASAPTATVEVAVEEEEVAVEVDTEAEAEAMVADSEEAVVSREHQVPGTKPTDELMKYEM